ncbi:S-layer homology domain-containing protein [Cohnella panacarvi]|uniref:S-layer homology domain-containing protein n=1 Tax=Cohnella panacarvi TaxID=400776 RepID=UPI000478DC77|nr:S-layer homology domain-containing protein [Cohnella panacarvi]
MKTVTTADGRTETTVSLESKDMSKAFEALESNAAASHKIHINVDQKSDSTKFELPAGALADKSKSGSDTVISFSSGIGSIDIPIRAIDYQELAKQLGVSLEDVKLFVTISAPNAEQDNKIREQAKAQNVNISKITNFSVAATGGGKSQEITSFGKTYVQRTIQVSEKVAGKEYMAVIIDSETGELQFIPSSVNAKGEIVIMAPHASTYAIVEKAKVTFSDIRSHWAKSDIETLASKLLVKGTSADTFSPDKDISRAEFAALIARGLGLEMVESDTAFTDVAATGWYAKAVRATVQAGIVQGRTDTTFAPSATITREEMSVMLAKALAFVGRQPDVSAKQSSLLAAFADNVNISDWAKAFAAQSVDAKVLSGDAQGKFNPQQKATRAEAVSTLNRLLDYIKFIN